MIVMFKEEGNSMSVTIPLDISKEEKDNITIESLFENYKGNYKPIEFNWNEVKGFEVW